MQSQAQELALAQAAQQAGRRGGDGGGEGGGQQVEHGGILAPGREADPGRPQALAPTRSAA